MEFPLYKTKREHVVRSYNLNDPVERRMYFHDKAEPQIEKLKQYLDKNTFVGFLLAKKAAGKGTYSKMIEELVGEDRISLISIGDLVRDTHAKFEESSKYRNKLISYLKPFYRGYITLEDSIDALLGRSTSTLIPSEFILALIKSQIFEHKNKAIFIDGFPRSLDQVSYSLYFREIMNLRPDPDLFILVDVPEAVIDERLKYRVVCPLCHTSRNLKLLPTKFVEHVKSSNSYVLKCDNDMCEGFGKKVMVTKEGDDQGIEAIRDRIKKDGELITKISSLQGVPKVFIRNSLPVSGSEDLSDPYEITPEYVFSVDSEGKVATSTKPWIVKDDSGNDSYSLLAAPAVLSLIDQLNEVLGL